MFLAPDCALDEGRGLESGLELGLVEFGRVEELVLWAFYFLLLEAVFFFVVFEGLEIAWGSDV